MRLSTTGATTISYSAKDFAGNQEASHQLKVFNASPFACMPTFTATGVPAHGTLAVAGSYTVRTSSGPVTTPFSFTITF